jgi:beta-lactamase superfamily II metal-dependent hydrolase
MRTIKMLSLMCMVFLIFTLVSCAQQKNDNVLHQGQQANSDITSLPTDNAEDVPEDNGWRTDEIFDTEKYKGKLQLRFFNLEDETRTGESMLITTPDGINMLIDAGIKKVGPQVIDYLKKLKVEKLDYIVVSHFHSDHIGGMAAVVGEFDVDKIMMCEMPYNTTLKKELDEAVLRKNCEVIYLKEGVFFKLGDEVEIEILNPQAEIVSGDWQLRKHLFC